MCMKIVIFCADSIFSQESSQLLNRLGKVRNLSNNFLQGSHLFKVSDIAINRLLWAIISVLAGNVVFLYMLGIVESYCASP